MADFRVFLYRPDGTPEGELSKDAGTLLSCTRTEEVNGERSLSLTTERHLEVGTRALTHHTDGRWREWVVDEPSETHDTGDHAVGTYHLCWSLQYDLQATYGPIQVIGYSPASASADALSVQEMTSSYTVEWRTGTSARTALAAALSKSRMWWWGGGCDVETNAYNVVMEAGSSAWDRLTTVVKYWGGEVDAEITVGDEGVTQRRVLLRSHIGSTSARRRFDWGHDLTGITRTPDPGPYYCRYIPLGDGESEDLDDDTTFEVPLTISGEPSFVNSEAGLRHDRGDPFIRDTQSELTFRELNEDGDWVYPTTAVSFSTDDPGELMQMALQDVRYKTRPGVAYSGTVANFALAGMDTDGIRLGDEVQVVDMGFNPDAPLRVQRRVLKIEVDEMGVEDAKLEIGKLSPRLERTMATTIETVGTTAVSYKMPQWDASKFEEETPELGHYTVDGRDSGGVSYEVPSVDYDIPDYGTAIADLQGQVSDIASGDTGGTGHDGIVHQFNGEVMTEGVINFTTASSTDTPKPSAQDAADWGKLIAGAVASTVNPMLGPAIWWGTGGSSGGGTGGGSDDSGGGGAGHSF